MKRSPHGWTVDTAVKHLTLLLKAADRRHNDLYKAMNTAVDLRFVAAEKAVVAALAAADKAVTKAEDAATKRADASNEIRGAMDDATAKLATKAETDIRFSGHDARLAILEGLGNTATGRGVGRGEVVAWIVAGLTAVSLVVGMVVVVIAR